MNMSKRKKHEERGQPGRFAYEGLDRVLHEKARLGIMTSLVTRPEGLLFGELKRLCALTDGNLSRHLDVLHDAGLVEVWKGFENRRPQTLCRLSPEGRQRFVAYLEELEQVIRDAMPRAARRSERVPEVPPGWQPAAETPLIRRQSDQNPALASRFCYSLGFEFPQVGQHVFLRSRDQHRRQARVGRSHNLCLR
jgi:DNA-binding MarR family transcriptional regulator